ncbi:MAG: UDP-3-O-(3-hydroxymyristoyl)glucosamine N-acyltransferase [Elusimicrobia bacterium]|nr:UDP-3-O-(3-hydroxymyristoyl)glucosamine N-acyltransferase [Elusimicrobiota bacterium]
MNLRDLARTLALDVKGPPDYEIKGVRDVETLFGEQDLEENYVYFVESQAVLKRHPKAVERGAILTVPALAERFPRALVAPQGGARLAFIALLKRFDRTPSFPAGVSPEARVHPSAKIAPSAAVLAGAVVMAEAVVGERCVLYPGVVLEPFARVGDDTVLYPAVVVGHHCAIGRRCIVHGGTVIGADGFGFYDDPAGRHKIPQIGNVVVADDVELGASCTVDRATIESTTIGEHTKIDDQVHIGHNCRVGRYIYIVGNTAIGGSVVIEDGAMLSGMVIVKDHLRIAKGSIVMGLSGVAQDTEPKTAYFGTPARPARQMHKMNAALERLPELLGKVRELEEKVGRLEAARANGSSVPS